MTATDGRDAINARDFAYIEERLLTPAVDTLAAVERLREAGHGDLATEVMAALQTFTDACREARRKLTDRRSATILASR